MALFKGTATALITPFKEGKIDYVSLGKLIEWQIAQGVDALVVCGTTGEASALSDKEKVQLTKFAADLADGRLPIIAGSGSNCTASAVRLSAEMREAGADGLLVVTPYYNKCSDEGLMAHYEAVADAAAIPVIMYSVPSRTGVNIKPEVAAKLAAHPYIAGIKDASGDMSQVCAMAALAGEDFALYSGNDDLTVPLLSLGGDGCISTVANLIPARFSAMVRSYLRGDCSAAGKEQVALKPLIDAIFAEVNPIPVKAALSMMGMCRLEYRLPLTPPANKLQYMLYDTLCEYSLLG